MQKIPRIFHRNNDGFAVDRPNRDCDWVFEGEGYPTQLLDGLCVLIRNGMLFKRVVIGGSDAVPNGFEPVDNDRTNGTLIGWVPCRRQIVAPRCLRRAAQSQLKFGHDKHVLEAFNRDRDRPPGTYELLGPGIMKNPENYKEFTLVEHATARLPAATPRSFSGIRAWFALEPIVAGVVWRHPDGRLAKVRLSDFGIERLRDINPRHVER